MSAPKPLGPLISSVTSPTKEWTRLSTTTSMSAIRKSSPIVDVDIVHDGEKPGPKISPVKKMCFAERPFDAVLHEVSGPVLITGQLEREAMKRGQALIEFCC